MKVNKKTHTPQPLTHEGGKASRINALEQLKRTVMSCLLWEKGFYEDGVEVAARIRSLVSACKPADVWQVAIDAREKMNLRHAPLLIARELARTDGATAGRILDRVIKRADEMAEFVAIYFKDGKEKLANGVKRALARAFERFDEYQLAKYNRDGDVTMRDVAFLVHAKTNDIGKKKGVKAKPINKKNYKRGETKRHKGSLIDKLIKNTLPTPETWEVLLSAGKDKKATFTKLLKERTEEGFRKLPDMAFIRNLRNMIESGVDKKLLVKELRERKFSKLFPYRFIAAANHAPMLADELQEAMYRAVEDHPKLPGITNLVVDVSGSMEASLSSKSEMSRMDAAASLSVLIREQADFVNVFTFSNAVAHVKSIRGFGLIEAIKNSQPHAGTYLAGALRTIVHSMNVKADRTIVITDEQSHDDVEAAHKHLGKCYIINVGTDRNGVGYGLFTHISGFSEKVIDYIMAKEKEED